MESKTNTKKHAKQERQEKPQRSNEKQGKANKHKKNKANKSTINHREAMGSPKRNKNCRSNKRIRKHNTNTSPKKALLLKGCCRLGTSVQSRRLSCSFHKWTACACSSSKTWFDTMNDKKNKHKHKALLTRLTHETTNYHPHQTMMIRWLRTAFPGSVTMCTHTVYCILFLWPCIPPCAVRFFCWFCAGISAAAFAG